VAFLAAVPAAASAAASGDSESSGVVAFASAIFLAASLKFLTPVSAAASAAALATLALLAAVKTSGIVAAESISKALNIRADFSHLFQKVTNVCMEGHLCAALAEVSPFLLAIKNMATLVKNKRTT